MTAVVDEQFSLRDLCRDVLDTTEATDMRAIAREVADQVPVQHLRAALAEALIDLVRSENLRGSRDHRLTASKPANPTRWQAASAAYLGWIQAFVGIPGTATQKRRSEVTVAEQGEIAEYRKAQAAGMVKEAQREFLIYQKMRDGGAETVGDLPEAVVLEILRWEPKQ